MDDNEFSFLKNLIGDTHDEEAPAPVQEMPPSHTPRYSARHKKSFLSFLKKGPQKAARKRLPPQIVSIYFGVPGSGKTTYAAYLARHDIRRGIPVWSNVPITGCYQLDPKTDIGTYMITGGRVIIDEAVISRTFPTNHCTFTNTIGITSLPSTFSVRALTIWTKRFGRLRKSFMS